MFLFILLLEDFGYMARAAFLMDRIMGGAGLHGRAFIPLLSSFACAIPGIMATRVIDSRRDRLTTILVAPLMTCSARIPVYTLIISAFIPATRVWGWVSLQGLVMFGLYAAGIVSALGVSFVANHFFWREDPTPPFMLELPDYKLPRLRNVAIGLYIRAKMFLHRAGTTIFSMMVLIWFLARSRSHRREQQEPAINYSLAAMIGHASRAGIGARSGSIGRSMSRSFPAWRRAKSPLRRSGRSTPSKAARKRRANRPGACAAMEPRDRAGACSSGIFSRRNALPRWRVIRRETGSWRWMALTFGYMLALAYLAAFVTFRVAVALGAG